MALFEPGAIIGRIRGRVGGVVFSNSRSSPVVRSWSYPTDPAAPLQATRRANLAIAAARWRDQLTPAHRDGWSLAAAQARFTDSLGNRFTPTGRELYIRGFIFAALVEVGVPDVGPFRPTAFWPQTFLTTRLFTPLTVHATGDVSGFGTLLVYAQLSPALNPTINHYDGPWEQTSISVWINSTSPLQVFDASTFTTSDRYFLKLTPGSPVGVTTPQQFYKFTPA